MILASQSPLPRGDAARSTACDDSPPPVPARFNFAADVLARRAAEDGEAPAVIGLLADGTEERWTCSMLARASGRLAAAMAASGLVQGDRVLVLMPRVPMFQVAMLACLHLGLVPVPCVTQLSGSEVAYRSRQCAARGILTSGELVDRCGGALEGMVFAGARRAPAGWADLDAIVAADHAAPPFASLSAEDPALIYFTSGSSGLPKAVVHASRGIFVRAWQPWRQIGMGPADVIWTPSDTGWTRAGSCLLFGPLAHGATAIIAEGALDPKARLDLLERFGVTIYAAVSTDLRQLLARSTRRALSLRLTIAAGEAMTTDLAVQWQAFTDAPLVVGYGQTETPTATLTDPSQPPRNGMLGRPMAGNRLTVIDESGVELPPGATGQIAFSADDPGLMLGYWRDGHVVPGPRSGPWHPTGDCGWREEDGNLFFLGRDDDVISSAGYRIGPTEVENALALHPAVRECAVAASPDAERGEIVKAFVVLQAGVAPGERLRQELQDHVKALVAPYKYPRAIAFLEDLPRTASGKLSRRLLREAEFHRRPDR